MHLNLLQLEYDSDYDMSFENEQNSLLAFDGTNIERDALFIDHLETVQPSTTVTNLVIWNINQKLMKDSFIF